MGLLAWLINSFQEHPSIWSFKQPHFAPKARQVIFIYLPGGCSHVDSFDYKPKLSADAKAGALYQGKRKLLAPLGEFKPRGKSVIYIDDLFPRIGDSADDICFINRAAWSNAVCGSSN